MSPSDLRRAIYHLYELLAEKVNAESAYQGWAETNGVIFEVLGYDAVKPFEKRSGNCLPHDPERNFTPEPDFLCCDRATGIVTIFELKTPFVSDPITERGDGNRKKFNAKLESYLSQATEYADSIRERESARHVVKDALGLTAISACRICLVYGISDNADESAVTKLCENRKSVTEILFFDRLLNRLAASYLATRSDGVRRTGASVVHHLVLSPDQIHSPAYIADFGEPLRNRLSVFVENDYLVFRCIDGEGAEHRLRCGIQVNTPLFLQFEFSDDDQGIYLSLNVNNEERDLRVGSVRLAFQLNLQGMRVGSDRFGTNGAKFQMLETYVHRQTLDFWDKLEMFRYFKGKTKEAHKCVEFDGTSYLVRNQEGNLQCEIGRLGPMLRDNFGYR